jgi:N-lysine methyltransferase SETD6
MLNADADLNNARLEQEPSHLVMRTICPVKAGEQLFNDYGDLPRSDLLRRYGYITPNYAKYDVIEFAHSLLLEVGGVEESASAWVKAEERLTELEVLDDGYSVGLENPNGGLDENVPDDLHTVLRALTRHPDATKLKRVKPGEPMTMEEAALLSAAASKRLSEYATTLDVDRKILAQSPIIPPNEHVRASRYVGAVSVRLGEKEILQFLIDRCADRFAELQSESRGTKNLAGKNQKKRKPSQDGNRSRKAVKANGNR